MFDTTRFLAQTFAAELRRPEPERLALVIARLGFPDLAFEPYLREIDELARQVGRRLEEVGPGAARAQAFMTAMRDDLGFTGNSERYYDAENSFLNRVLARRTGLPIMLSVLCMAIGNRLGLTVEGMGFPGHFMARYRDDAGAWLLDPFYGVVVEPREAADYLAERFGQPVRLAADVFQPVTPVALALRILNNLRNVYLGHGNTLMAAQVLDLMLVVTPDSALLWQERGVLAYRDKEWEAAARALRRYLFLTDQLHLTLPNNEEAEPPTTGQVDRHLLAMLQEVEAVRARLN